jgi:hypothetical protein
MEVNMRWWWYVAGLLLAFVVGSMVGDAIGTYHCAPDQRVGTALVGLL